MRSFALAPASFPTPRRLAPAFALLLALHAPHAAAVGGPEGATVAPDSKVALSDARWMEKVARIGIAEVEMGKLAAQQAKQNEVRMFAQTMVERHGAANEELRALAASKGVLLPVRPDGAHARFLKKLAALSADKFDKEYLTRAGAKDQTEAATLLQDEKLKDPELQAYAAKTLPMVKRHFEMAREIRMP
jgi:putative membrane protein